MAARILPTTPGLVSAVPRVVSLRNDLRSAIGGDLQRIQRKGDHYALDVVVEPMDLDTAREWQDIRTAADVVRLEFPQPNFDPGPVGSPRVAGAGQAGSILALDGLTPGLIIRKGQFLNVISNDRYWLYGIDQTVVVDASGEAEVTLEVMLRYPPADNDVIVLDRPMIEGFATVAEDAFKLDAHWLVNLAFSIEERG